MRAVLSAIHPARMRCREHSACWATVLTGTGRIASLRWASSMPLVSARSVLLRPTLVWSFPVPSATIPPNTADQPIHGRQYSRRG